MGVVPYPAAVVHHTATGDERMHEAGDGSGETREADPERARIREMLIGRGIPEREITEVLIDIWIVQDAKDREEGRRLGYHGPSSRFFGSGQ
jgi:hypothetical protein